MNKIALFLAVILMGLSACNWMGYTRIRGNGHVETQDRPITRAERIKLVGSYDVEITQGVATTVKVEADENLQPYLMVRDEDGFLVIKSKNKVSFSTEHPIKIYITTPKLEKIYLVGSGNVIGKNKFTGSNKLELKIAGSGDIDLEVNTPEIASEISGSGNITIKGETRDAAIHISGVGNFNAEDLKTENAIVKIAGSGDVKIFAEKLLDIHIAGVGSVFYKGSAIVKQKIAGSGEVKKID